MTKNRQHELTKNWPCAQILILSIFNIFTDRRADTSVNVHPISRFSRPLLLAVGCILLGARSGAHALALPSLTSFPGPTSSSRSLSPRPLQGTDSFRTEGMPNKRARGMSDSDGTGEVKVKLEKQAKITHPAVSTSPALPAPAGSGSTANFPTASFISLV